MINLCLVVIATQFAETKRRETERMLEERRKLRSHSISTYLMNNSIFCILYWYDAVLDSNSEQPSLKESGQGDSVYAAMVRLLGQWNRRTKRYILRRWRRFLAARRKESQPVSVVPDDIDDQDQSSKHSQSCNDIDVMIVPASANRGGQSELTLSVTDSNALDRNGSVKRWSIIKTKDWQSAESNAAIDDEVSGSKRPPNRSKGLTIELAEPEKKHSKISSGWSKFRSCVKKIVSSEHFTRGILIAILVNTLR